MSRPANTALQAVLVVVLLLLLLVQLVVLPAQAAQTAAQFPQAAFLRVPVLAIAILTVACAQLAVVCVMALLSLVGQQRIFDPVAYRWVDLFIGATALASLLVLGTGFWVSFTVGSPAWISASLLAVVGAGITLLMLVIRALLRQATEQHAELAEVV